MSYVEDENGNPIIDENGNKMTFTVSHVVGSSSYVHREMLHIDNDGHINTENRHIVIKDGVNSNHAVSKGQLDIVRTETDNTISSFKSDVNNALTTMKTDMDDLLITIKSDFNDALSSLETDIDEKMQTSLRSMKTEIINLIPSDDPIDPSIAENAMKEFVQSSTQLALKKFQTNLFKFINKRMKGRVGKKSLIIPKTNYTWIKLLDVSEIDGVDSLDEVLIQDMYIKRTDRYHNAKSSHTANAFTNLEFFYDDKREKYYCYFDNHPSSWSMDCFFHYVKIPEGDKR